MDLSGPYRSVLDTMLPTRSSAGRLEAGDPKGEIRNAWHAKELVRPIQAIDNSELAVESVTQLGIDLQDESRPPEIQHLGRTIKK